MFDVPLGCPAQGCGCSGPEGGFLNVGRLSASSPRQGFDVPAEVLGGPALRTRMAEEVRAMAALYAGEST
jgi:hypothetical protein